MVVGVLLAPALLIAAWVRLWFVRRHRRWHYYFPAALAAVLLVAAVTDLIPKPPCTTVPTACVDDVSLSGVLGTLAGLVTWLVLLVVTAVVELSRHVAYVSRLRRTTDRS